ncbi:2Fe-2S iron-sulfur cluster-binding protein [Rhodococcus koreensis]|uniref:2Fe-2S iron-sulfur cluster-binding protein n=1 Tax=Rhodococcus koreensis TaxID=99653 RepID=UPI00197DD3DA|nr:2Fe-2S iron-sulfur cluster-binding protein [Rhodococcus koreensis]QSE80692.1 (2Fe-2S)-binding protein [Rhodococcus koreensis]
MNAPFRTRQGGRLDRTTTHTFTFDGQELTGHPGDTLGSALLANGVHQITTSIKLGRPRGITAAWAEDTGGLVQIEEPFPEPMLLATTIELFDGLVARGIPGQGRLATIPDSAKYDATHHHTDLLIAGAGPAGLAAALTAARAGARVVLLDEQSEAGGDLLGSTDLIDGAPALDWAAAAVAELATYPDVLHLQRTTAFGHYDDGFVLALQRRTDHLGGQAPAAVSRQRVWRIRARHILVAAGAHERPVVFTDNDRPGIMLAHGARTFLHRYGVTVGAQAVVFTTNDSAYQAAIDLHDAGVRINAVVEARDTAPARWQHECEARGIPVRTASVVSGTRGNGRVSHALVTSRDDTTGTPIPLACDALLVSGGWNPAVHLFSQARGTLKYDDTLGAFVPGETLDGVTVAGSANGILDLPGCLHDGENAGREILGALGFTTPDVASTADNSGGADSADDGGLPPLVLWRVPDPAGQDTQFVDVQRDATVADLARAVGAGMTSMEHIKRYTTIGTAHDQGKTSGVISSGITAELLHRPIETLGTTTFRPPYTPVPFAALAGRARGTLFDPERVTALHDWHLGRGAVFEDVGQWKRPRYYPHPGEDMDTAVLRECAAVRAGVGILDGSTLGKIDVQGPDAGVLLDMLYTNMMSTLKVGMVRYGLMCGVDGMVIDDGTIMRLAEDRYQVFTTTGGAAKILDWMEEWLQTEWPHLQVRLTSVTEHWATFPVVGPRSRDVIGEVFGDLDVTNDAFPFMAWRDTTLAGVHVRIARVSFSGELAYEVNVGGWHAPAIWARLIAAGDKHNITPYGTETMHVLRAEKGYPIIGQDTDGTVTPQDLGMSWAVSKKKADFIGKRSFTRQENQNPLRKQFVGLLPLDQHTVLPEGAQIIEHRPDGTLPPPPVPMLGHVTSSYMSAELGRPFGLALVKGGHTRIGDTLHVPVDGNLVAVQVTGTVLVDPEGARRDG